MKLFCENRNKFFESETHDMTRWSKDTEKGKVFSFKDAMKKREELRSMIIDSEYIILVENNFKGYS